MSDQDANQQSTTPAKGAGTQAGKRYGCSQCGSEALVTRASAGGLTCCSEPMEKK